MTNRQQSAFFLAIIFLFTSGIGLVIYRQYDLYYQEKAAIDLEAASVIGAPLKDLSVSTTPKQINGWKTYVYKDYGIEVNYPSSWKISTDPKNPSTQSIEHIASYGEEIVNQAYGAFTISKMPLNSVSGKKLTLDELISDYGGSGAVGSSVILDGLPAKMSQEQIANLIEAIVIFEKPSDKNNFYLINMEARGSDQHLSLSVLEEILSTFKFTN